MYIIQGIACLFSVGIVEKDFLELNTNIPTRNDQTAGLVANI